MHLTQLQVFENQLEQVAGAMTARLFSIPEALYLLSCPCLKPTSAALFLAEVGDPQRYQKAAQWVKLAGIQPVPNTSGRKQRSRTPMYRQLLAQTEGILKRWDMLDRRDTRARNLSYGEQRQLEIILTLSAEQTHPAVGRAYLRLYPRRRLEVSFR